MIKRINAYKGFNKDMTSKYGNFQYEEGKEYKIEGEIKLCKNGFHACTNPLQVFRYYYHNNSVYHEVELYGDIIRDEYSSKLCASKIKIGKRLDPIKDMIEPNLDTDTEVVHKGNLQYRRECISIAKKPGDITVSYNFTKGVIGSYLSIYDIIRYNFIVLKVDGERIKEDCCYRYYNGKIEEYKKRR